MTQNRPNCCILDSRDRISKRLDCILGVMPAVPSEDFGREALLAEGLINDHDAGRYEVVLEAGSWQMERESRRAMIPFWLRPSLMSCLAQKAKREKKTLAAT